MDKGFKAGTNHITIHTVQLLCTRYLIVAFLDVHN